MMHKSLKRKARAAQRITDVLLRRLNVLSTKATLTSDEKAALPSLRKAAHQAIQYRCRLDRRTAKRTGVGRVPLLMRSTFKVSAEYKQRLQKDGREAAFAGLETRLALIHPVRSSETCEAKGA
jgi:hypothetical protein